MLDYQKQQQGFAAYIRDPDNQAAPTDVEERRLKIYRELFYNNIENFVSGAFPVFKTLFNSEEWQSMVRDFMVSHRCHSPYFLEISQEFMQWLDNETLAVHNRYPFTKELLHYEWAELALDVAEETEESAYDFNGDLIEGMPVISAVAWPLVYEWPVHHIGANQIPQHKSPQPNCLIVYRNRNNKVEFMETNPVTVRLLEIIGEGQSTGKQAIEQLAREMGREDVDNLLAFGADILNQLHATGILLGTQLPD